MEQVRQRIIAGYHLRPLDVDELQAYIEHRLHTVGWQGDPEITEAAFSRIYEATGGVPRRVNTLTDRLLLFGCLEELHKLDAAQVDTVVEEVSQEIGHTRLGSEEEFAADLGRPLPLDGQASSASGDLVERVRALEHALESLRGEVRRDRRLLKKAILLNMDVDDDEGLV